MAKTNFTSYQKTPNDPTIVATTEGGDKVGFENTEQAFKSGVSADFNNVQTVDSIGSFTPYSTYFPQKVTVDPPDVIPAESLVGNQVTSGDVKTLVNDVNLNYLEQQKALEFKPGELDAMKRRAELTSDLRNTNLEKMQREIGIRDQGGETGQAIVGRQINQLGRYIAYKQIPLINEIQAQSDIIAQFQAQRGQMLKQLEISMNQGQFNLGLAKEYDAQKKAEQKEIKDLIIKSGISARYAEINGTVYDSATGEALSLAEFQRRTGQTVGAPVTATSFKMVEGLESATNKIAMRQIVADLASKYFDAGVLPSDSIETAMQKIKAGSAIYREQVRPPSSGGSGEREATLKESMNMVANQIIGAWEDNGYIQGNGTISSSDYKNAKREWNRTFAGLTSNPGKAFDDLFGSYIDRGNLATYARDYGIAEE